MEEQPWRWVSTILCVLEDNYFRIINLFESSTMKDSGNWDPDDWNSHSLSLAQNIVLSRRLDGHLHEHNREARGNRFWAPKIAFHPEYVFSAKATFEDEFSMTVEGFRID
jgi:hypothetical protein